MIKFILSLLLLIVFTGCDDVKDLQESRYKDYPKVCKDYLQTYDGRYIRGKGGTLSNIHTIMEYCKFRENQNVNN